MSPWLVLSLQLLGLHAVTSPRVIRQKARARAGNDSGGECGVAVTARFTMPDRAPGAWRAERQGGGRREEGSPASRAPFWYSFEYGSAHFAVISTEHDLSDGSDQRQVQRAPSFDNATVLGTVAVDAFLVPQPCCAMIVGPPTVLRNENVGWRCWVSRMVAHDTCYVCWGRPHASNAPRS